MNARAMQASALRAARVRRLLGAMLLTFGASAAPASDTALARIDALIASEAWQLAGRAIAAVPADAGVDPQELERRRLTVFRHLPDPAALAERIENLPAATPDDFRRWALEQLFEAALAARDLERAQRALEQRLQSAGADDVRPWRRRLVRAYLDERNAQAALAAFAPLADDDESRTLHAEILVRLGRDREAFEALAGLKSPEARLWRLIAALRLELYAPADAVTELALLVRQLRERPDLQRLAWLVRAQAAKQIGQLARRVNSLEQAHRLDRAAPAVPLVPASADELWSAYLALARHAAQKEDLSLGEATLARADAMAARDPYTARALYAWHAVESNDADVRTRAHERLVVELAARDLGGVARALYTESRRFATGELPSPVRHALYAHALQRKDVAGAARIARELDEPPPNMTPREWNLRRARVLLYGGDADAAAARLRELVTGDEFDAEFAPRLLQVVFDLQAFGRHADALGLLESVYERVDNARMHREILYWRAESAAALERYADAAELYLRSARFGESNGSDPWGHSARFRAAEALAKAGLSRDAEALYRGLLKETESPERRLLIEQNLERLWLAHPATTP